MIETRGTAFHEVQRFRQPWVLVIVLGIAGLMWYSSIDQLLLRRPFGSNPAPDALLAVYWVFFGIGLPALFLSCSLVTEVREEGIYVRFFPFHRSFRRIPFADVKRLEVREYHPVKDYGGWGIKYGRHGLAYNVRGNRGVLLEMTDGKSIMLGSQRAADVLSFRTIMGGGFS